MPSAESALERILISAVALLMAWGCGMGEPRYRLRTADYWIGRRAESTRPREWRWRRPSGEPAIQALRTIGPAAVPACMRAVGHFDLHMRLAGVETLAMYGAASRTAIPLLIDRTRDPQGHEYSRGNHDWEFTEAVGRVLPAIDPDRTQTVGMLSAALAAPHPATPARGPGGIWQPEDYRDYEAWLIGEIGRIHLAYLSVTIDESNVVALEIILQALAYEDPQVRALPAESRASLWAGKPVSDGEGRRVRNREPMMRAHAAEAVKRLPHVTSRMVDLLAHILTEGHYNEPCGPAAIALGRVDPSAPAAPAARRALLQVLVKATKGYKEFGAEGKKCVPVQEASEALARLHPQPTDLPTLLMLLTHPGPDMDATWNQPKGGPPEWMLDPRPEVAWAAARALTGMGEEAIPALVSLLDDEEPRILSRASNALSLHGQAAAPASAALTTLLGHSHPVVQRSAAYALGAIGPAAAEATERLRILTHDDDPLTRTRAGWALQKIESPTGGRARR